MVLLQCIVSSMLLLSFAGRVDLTTPTDLDERYMGCFTYDAAVFPVTEDVLNGRPENNFSLTACMTKCFLQGYPLTAVKALSQCWCGGQANTAALRPAGPCEEPCWENTLLRCGSGDGTKLSVYRATEDSYVGCFRTDTAGLLDQATKYVLYNMSITLCRNHCRTHNYPLAGVQFAYKCYCGGKASSFENLSRLGRSPDCTSPCPGDNQTACGGTYAMSIYLTNVRNYRIEHQSVGCFRDDTARVLGPVKVIGLTLNQCVTHCRVLGFRLAGAENGEDCYCGGNEGDADNVYRVGRAYSCNTPCRNATWQVCGGEWALSVLKTMADNYIECVRDDSHRVLDKLSMTSPDLTIPTCAAYCNENGYPLVGMGNGTDCFCGGRLGSFNNVFRLRNSLHCDTPCSGDNETMCGGEYALSVYTTHSNFPPAYFLEDSNYLDCFRDDGARVLVSATRLVRNDMSVPTCIAHCKAKGYPLAGLEYAGECYCGGKPWEADNVYRLGPAHNCDMRCRGDGNAFCGGTWALSVYLTDSPEMLRAHVGCFRDDGAGVLVKSTLKTHPTMTPQHCIAYCKDLGYPLAGIEDQIECYCGGKEGGTDDVYRLGRSDNCHHQCTSDAGQICGGPSALSVYRTGVASELRSYVDCFQDDHARVLVKYTITISKSQTIPRCISRCKDRGYPLAGLENGRECHCGGKPGGSDNAWRLGTARDKCNKPCSGDSNSRCGGPWVISVYRTGVSEGPGSKTFSQGDAASAVSAEAGHGARSEAGVGDMSAGVAGMLGALALTIGGAVAVCRRKKGSVKSTQSKEHFHNCG